jgi:diguanylate cyclase (GGDEF)-like protein
VNSDLVVLELARSEVPPGTASETDALRRSLEEALAMVREAVATIAGDQANLDESLAGSAERVEQIARSNDIRQIQARLADEVARLKRITRERRAAWEHTVGAFQTRLTRLEQQLDTTRREASLDPLTNVANRRMFEGTCREWLAANHAAFVMAMVDVDDFKAINDRHGHAVGDRVLITVAETLTKSLRSHDVVARLGGDEFVVLAPGLAIALAGRRFAGIAGAVQTACAAIVAHRIPPSISIGLAERVTGDTMESLQQRADAALYDAKRNGKGRVAIKAAPPTRDLMNSRHADEMRRTR